MSEQRKIKVPEGMLTAGSSATTALGGRLSKEDVRTILEAALRWQRLSSPRPTDQQAFELRNLALLINRNYNATEPTCASCVAVAMEWISRMYEAPEPAFEPQSVFFTKPGDYYVHVPVNGLAPKVGPIESCVRDRSFEELVLEPEVEVPDQIRDLYFGGLHEGLEVTELVRTRVLEAFRRGQQSARNPNCPIPLTQP